MFSYRSRSTVRSNRSHGAENSRQSRSTLAIRIVNANRLAAIATAVCLIFWTGCSKESVNSAINTASDYGNDLVNDAQDVANDAVNSVKKELPPTGKISLRMTPAIDVSTCSIRLINFGDDRASVVQISNYPFDQKPTSYPQVFIQGQSTASSLSGLKGKTIDCDMFVRATSSDPIISTPDGRPVRVRVSKVDTDKQTITASISRTQLTSTNNSVVNLSRGSITAVMVENADEKEQQE